MSARKLILAACLAAMAGASTPATFANFVGGNIDNTLDFNTARLHNNALYDSRGFGIVGGNARTYTPISGSSPGATLSFLATSGTTTMSIATTNTVALTGDYKDVGKIFNVGGSVATVTVHGTNQSATVVVTGTLTGTSFTVGNWSVDVPRDANGFPTIAFGVVITSVPGGGTPAQDGQLAAGTYPCYFISADQTSAISGATSVGTQVSLGGGLWKTPFVLTATTGVNLIISFSSSVTYVDIARDGSGDASGQPLFSSTALAHFAQFVKLRSMDFSFTNTRTDAYFTQSPPDYAVYHEKRSWNYLTLFATAVYNYAGSKFTKLHLCIPSSAADSTYAGALSAFLTGKVPVGLQIQPERGNEEWNPKFVLYGNDVQAANPELKLALTSAYGGAYSTQPQITSIVGNGTSVTVTMTAGTLPAYITNGASFVCNTQSSPQTWTVGSVAAPAVVTSVTSNSFTYASTQNITANVATEKIAYFFGLTSTLLTDNLSYNLYYMPYKYHVRAHYANWNAWKVNRPQDKFILSWQIQATSGSPNAAEPIQLQYAAWVNGGSATWAYAGVIAPYLFSNNTDTTVDQVFATLNTSLATFEPQMQFHIYSCLAYGLVPMLYEAGPDLSILSSSLTTAQQQAVQLACCYDVRMQTLIVALLTFWFQHGGGEACYYQVSPAPYSFWSALQTYADTANEKLLALQAMMATTRSYVNITDAGSDLTATNGFWHTADTTTLIQATTQVIYSFSTTLTPSYGFLFTIPTAGNYTITVIGTSSIANTKVNILLNLANVGSETLAVGGSANSAAAVPAASTDTITLNLAAGGYALQTLFNGPSSQHSGVKTVRITPA